MEPMSGRSVREVMGSPTGDIRMRERAAAKSRIGERLRP